MTVQRHRHLHYQVAAAAGTAMLLFNCVLTCWQTSLKQQQSQRHVSLHQTHTRQLLTSRHSADIPGWRLSGNLRHRRQETSSVRSYWDAICTQDNDDAGDEKFRGCWPSHLEQFTSRSANCNSLPSDVRSTFEGPPVWLIRQRVWGLFMTRSTNPLIIIIIIISHHRQRLEASAIPAGRVETMVKRMWIPPKHQMQGEEEQILETVRRKRTR